MAEAKKKPAKKTAEVVEEITPVVKKAAKKEIIKDVCDACRFKKGGGNCKSCIEFK